MLLAIMLATLVLASLLVLSSVLTVEGQQIIPKCNENIINKINAYFTNNGYPSTLVVGSYKWTFLYYSLQIPAPVCVKEEVGNGKVTSTGENTQTNIKAFTYTVTFTGDVTKGLLVQTVQGTNETINLYVIKSTSLVNVIHLCDPNSKDVSAPQGGVAIPIGKHKDKATKEEAAVMQKVLKALGITTYSITPCPK